MEHPVAQTDKEWRSRSEVGIRVEGLPRGVTTLDVYQCFEREGAILRIQVPDPRDSGSSYVNFCPPPRRAFWYGEGPPVFYCGGPGRLPIRLRCFLTLARKYRISSPVDPRVQYDESTSLTFDTLDFGYMHTKTQYMVMRPVTSQPERPIKGTLNLRVMRLAFEFSLPEHLVLNRTTRHPRTDRAIKYRFELPVRDIDRFYMIGVDSTECELVFTAKTPPELYQKTLNIASTHDPRSIEWRDWYAWYRQTDVSIGGSKLAQQAVTLRKEDAVIDIGRWMTYRLRMNSIAQQSHEFDVFRRALADHNVAFITTKDIECLHGSGKEASIWKSIDLAPHVDSNSSLASLEMDHVALPFALRYQLEVCLSRGVLNEHNLTQDFVHRLIALGENHATSLLESAALQNMRYNDRFYDPEDVLRLRTPKPLRKRDDGHFAYMRAAQITPTMVYYSTPVLETSNRIIRHFFAYEDRFLRVSFSDEVGKIRTRDRDTNDEVYNRIRRTLRNGVRIGDRNYEFLAFGNSQFRENAAYFFASTNELKAAEIRTWMGDFRDIHTVAKWAARLGQSFSTTRSIHSARFKVSTETDVTRNGYNFTDGVGKISPFLAQLIAMEFGLKIDEVTCPSLFQFRMGGCKGVLVMDPTLRRSQEVIIRESQYKFPAVHEGLDVIRYSSFASSMLNRQIIIVLDTLGVSPSVFYDKQRAELAELDQAMQDHTVALNLLRRRIDFNQMTLCLANLVLDGFMGSNEPFVMSVLHLWRAWNIKYLKEKARITIDRGAFLLGCVDETVSLRGHYFNKQHPFRTQAPEHSQWLPEIFLQIRDPPHTGNYKVRTGPCLLARNPSLHPGDVRVVRAVDIPALHHLKDVVVLPQTGDRDIANMCSGGDLDGDDYLVIWDKDLFPPHVNWNRKPMNFIPPKGQILDREVDIEDVKEFFINYMKHNRLEVIAVSHLAQADRSEHGVDDPKCIELAELHSCAVDYPKSGVPAMLPQRLIPPRWPHFMGKEERRSYQSTSVLGQLYDQVQLADFKPLFKLQFDDRVLSAYDFESYQMSLILSKVQAVKQEYDKSVRRIMAKHSISSEFEVWSTFVLEHNRDKGDYKFHEEIGNLTGSLKVQYRDEIIAAAGGSTFDQLEPWVAAMYKVTADEMTVATAEDGTTTTPEGQEECQRELNTADMPFISFPWIFHSELGKIANARRDLSVVTDTHISAMQPAMFEKSHRTRPLPLEGDQSTVHDLDTPAGVVHAGEQLKLFQSRPSQATSDASSNESVQESGVVRPLQSRNGASDDEKGYDRGRHLTQSGSSAAVSIGKETSHGSRNDCEQDDKNDVDLKDALKSSALDRLAKMLG